jgi:signal transduction histidine kinase
MMNESKIPKKFERLNFDLTESQIKNVTLNITLTIGILTTLYFGISDSIQHRIVAGLISLFVTMAFGLILVLNILVPYVRKAIHVGFVVLVGTAFLILLYTQFPDPAIVFWCFPFPLVALFLLGRKQGAAALIIYSIGIIVVFLLDFNRPTAKYTYEYAIRYCGVMVVISFLAYYYEVMRSRSIALVHSLNQTLEQRVEERTKALEESQERLRQAEKIEAIGLLAGGIAHDFNNQLTGIMGLADLIRVSAQDNAEIRELAEGILSSSRRSAELTAQLLAFARKANLLAVPVDIHVVVANVVKVLEHTIDKRISLKQELVANPSTILGDPTSLENALLNLALNARDAMPTGGEMIFTTSIADLEESDCRNLMYDIIPGTYLRLSVTDSGCEMDKKTLNRLFEPFFTTKEPGKGTGMGLPAVYGTVRSLNGAIMVHSEPDRGSSFHLYLPILKMDGQIPAPLAESVMPEKGHGQILLVDDERIVSESVKKMLQLIGYSVTVFHNGKEASDFYSGNWKTIDLVIIDMIMPVMGGKDTFRAMKHNNPGVKALIASGYSLNGEAQSILDMGASGFIQKPFDITEFSERIADLLGNRA